MSDHLPECADAMIPDFHNERWVCICAALRACEQRVLEDERALIAVEQTTLAELNAEYRKGLDAARDAVARTCGHTKHQGGRSCAHDDALAAIDALREEQP